MLKILVYKNTLGFMRPRPENEPWEPLPEGVELIGHSMDGCKTIELLVGGTIEWPHNPKDVYDSAIPRALYPWERTLLDEMVKAEREEQKAKEAKERALAKAAREKEEQLRRVTYTPRQELRKIEERWAIETFTPWEEEPWEEDARYEQAGVVDLMESNSVFRR